MGKTTASGKDTRYEYPGEGESGFSHYYFSSESLNEYQWQVFWLIPFFDAFPLSLSSGFVIKKINGTYSSGDCPGFSPGSLLRQSVKIVTY